MALRRCSNICAINLSIRADEKELADDDDDDDANHEIWGRTSKQEIVAQCSTDDVRN